MGSWRSLSTAVTVDREVGQHTHAHGAVIDVEACAVERSSGHASLEPGLIQAVHQRERSREQQRDERAQREHDAQQPALRPTGRGFQSYRAC